MGFWDTLLGGTSKAPGDFYTPPKHEGQIMGAITPGLQTNRNAPQTGMDSPFRDSQLSQIGTLQGIANGTQKGAGELAAERQTSNAQAAQQAMARMARGGNAGLAYRQAGRNTAAVGLAGAGQAAVSAAGDQQNAQGLLTTALGQGRGQDSQIQLANMDAKLKQMGLDDAARLGYLAQLTGMDIATLQAQMSAYNQAQQNPGLIGPLLGAAGQVGAAYAGA